jgi:hypothetical protein
VITAASHCPLVITILGRLLFLLLSKLMNATATSSRLLLLLSQIAISRTLSQHLQSYIVTIA